MKIVINSKVLDPKDSQINLPTARKWTNLMVPHMLHHAWVTGPQGGIEVEFTDTLEDCDKDGIVYLGFDANDPIQMSDSSDYALTLVKSYVEKYPTMIMAHFYGLASISKEQMDEILDKAVRDACHYIKDDFLPKLIFMWLPDGTFGLDDTDDQITHRVITAINSLATIMVRACNSVKKLEIPGANDHDCENCPDKDKCSETKKRLKGKLSKGLAALAAMLAAAKIADIEGKNND